VGKVLELYKFEDHIRDCDNRYRDLEKRIDAVDQRLSRIEQLCLDIKEQLRKGAGQ
jgi:predicted  nucleic acid-binding Zn-ribbon protein